MVIRDKIIFLTLSLGLFLINSINGAVNDTPCDATFLNVGCGSKIILSNSGLGSTILPGPGCGTYSGSDIWVAILMPASGSVDIDAKSGTLTDISMAIYRQTINCLGTLTYLTCDDTSGSGNMPYIRVTGETPGTKIYVRLWDNFNDEVGNFELEVSEPDDLYCLKQHSIMYNFPTDTCVQVTSAASGQQGCAWYKNTIDFSQNFDNVFSVYFGNNDNGADGLTFTFHNDPVGNTACGLGGQYLGSGNIQNALTIEFDTYTNPHASEIAPDHIAVWTSISGALSPIAGPIQASTLTADIEDGVPHTVRISWNASTKQMNIYFDGTFRLSVTHDFVANVFGTNHVFWGSTGSTGFYYNQQYVCLPLRYSPLPVELLDFSAECNDEKVLLRWSTATEINNDYFTLERSHDAVNYETVAIINGHGNTNQEHHYSFEDEASGSVYYRLLQTDFDGSNEYVGGIQYLNCKSPTAPIKVFPNPVKDIVSLYLPHSDARLINIEVLDIYGRIIYHKELTGVKVNTIEITMNNFSVGTYFIKVDLDGKVYNNRILKITQKL